MNIPQVENKNKQVWFRKHVPRSVNLLLQIKNKTTQFKNQTTQARLQKCEFANSIQIAADRARIDGVDLVEVTSVACAAAEGTLVALLANLARIAGHPGADCSNPARTTGWASASDLPRLSLDCRGRRGPLHGVEERGVHLRQPKRQTAHVSVQDLQPCPLHLGRTQAPSTRVPVPSRMDCNNRATTAHALVKSETAIDADAC